MIKSSKDHHEFDLQISFFSLCCECGVSIEPNPTSQCIGCIRAKSNIAENIIKSASICFCKGCERYLDPPSCWINASLESKELLKLCLKKIKGLNQVHLVDARFVWTEPHSKRIKVICETKSCAVL